MKSLTLILSAVLLALCAPGLADARPDGGPGHGWRRDPQAAQSFRDQRRAVRSAPRPMAQFQDYRGRGRQDPRFAAPAYGGQGPIPRQMWRPRQDSLGAGWRQQQDEARSGVRQGRFVPLSRVLPQLQRRMPGRQLDAGIEQGWRGQPVYRVRWATANGRRIDFIVDARTGAILDAEGQ